jgi:Hg(II)-responsive transcriptional regulator
MDAFTIGELARQANVHVETLRYYERRGLLPKPNRTISNYRVYSYENLRRVKFIKQAQGLGFSLKEIKKLLALRATPRARCADVRTYAAHKIEDIDGKIRSLARMRKTLEKLIAECSGDGPATQCPILESLHPEPSTLVKESSQYRKERCYEKQTKNRNL